MVADSAMQCVQFDMSVVVERHTYESEMRNLIQSEVEQIEGVKSVEIFNRILLRDEIRFDMSINIERPSEDTGRAMSEFLLDKIFELSHVQEVRELTWRRLKSPLL